MTSVGEALRALEPERPSIVNNIFMRVIPSLAPLSLVPCLSSSTIHVNPTYKLTHTSQPPTWHAHPIADLVHHVTTIRQEQQQSQHHVLSQQQ